MLAASDTLQGIGGKFPDGLDGYLNAYPDAISSFVLAGQLALDPLLEEPPEIPEPPLPQQALSRKLETVRISSTETFQGKVILRYLGIVSGFLVIPLEYLRQKEDAQGMIPRYRKSQARFDKIVQLALTRLKLQAMGMDANAVVRVRLEHSLHADTMHLHAYGTAILVEE